MATLNYVLRDPTTGEGLPGQAVKLRIGPGFASDTHSLTDVSGKPGAYELADLSAFAAGEYELWVNGSKDNSFGRRDIYKASQLLFKSGGTMTGDINMGGNGITGLKTPLNDYDAVTKLFLASFYLPSSALATLVDIASVQTVTGEKTFDNIKISQLRRDLSAAGYEISGLVDPTVDSAAARRGYVLAQIAAAIEAAKDIFPQMTAGALDQNIYAQWTFRTLVPYILGTPVNPFHVPNVKFVKDYVNNYLNGISPTYQQTESVVIVDYNCTQENNRRYQKLEAAMIVANSYADATKRMAVCVEGGDTDAVDVVANYNKLYVTAVADYVDIIGRTQALVLEMEDSVYTAGALGRRILDNVTLNCPDTANTTLVNYILRNVKFTRSTGASGGFTLTDCIVENCEKTTATVAANAGCIGEILDVTNAKRLILSKLQDEGGLYDVLLPNGDIQGKRLLGRQGANIASASSITLGEGNYFIVTGTTTIATISTTNWTDGSVVNIMFSGILTLDTGGGNLIRIGGNITTVANQIVTFLMDSNSWIITNP